MISSSFEKCGCGRKVIRLDLMIDFDLVILVTKMCMDKHDMLYYIVSPF